MAEEVKEVKEAKVAKVTKAAKEAKEAEVMIGVGRDAGKGGKEDHPRDTKEG